MTAESRVLILTICSFHKDEGGLAAYDHESGIARQIHPEAAAQLLAARRKVQHLIKTPGAVLRDEKALNELRMNKELVAGPDFAPNNPEEGGQYLPAAQRYTGRFFKLLGGDPLATLMNTPHHVLIISGLYGLLRPTESIQCYSCHVPDHLDVPAAWLAGETLANALVSYIERHNITRIFELMGDNNYRQLVSWNQLQSRTGAMVLHTEGDNYSGADLLPSLGHLATQLLALPEEELLVIKPNDSRKVPGETITFRDHPTLIACITQASTLSGMGDHKQALQVLSSVRPENDGERAQLQEQRRKILAVVHKSARKAAEQGEDPLAADAYRFLLGHKFPELAARDHHHIAVLAEMAALEGDKLSHADAFASDVAERDLIELPYAPDLLLWRVERSRQSRDDKHLLRDYADLLDCVCLRGDVGGIRHFLGRLNHDREQRLLTRQQQFDILEGLESFTSDLPALAKILSAEYVAIGYAEFDLALRDDRPMPPYISGLLRTLQIRDATSLSDLEEYFRIEQEKLRAKSQSLPTTLVATEATVALTGLRLALVGGHQQARQHVLETLKKEHGLTHSVEVAPTSEGRQDTRSVSDKVRNCDLVIVIKNYLGHDLSGIVGDLERRGQLSGRAYWLDTRGQSGVVREVLQIAALRRAR